MKKLLLTIVLLAVGSQAYADVCSKTDVKFKDYVYWKTTEATRGYIKVVQHSLPPMVGHKVIVEREFWAEIPKGSLFLGEPKAGPDGKIHTFYCDWGESNIYLPINKLEKTTRVY